MLTTRNNRIPCSTKRQTHRKVATQSNRVYRWDTQPGQPATELSAPQEVRPCGWQATLQHNGRFVLQWRMARYSKRPGGGDRRGKTGFAGRPDKVAPGSQAANVCLEPTPGTTLPVRPARPVHPGRNQTGPRPAPCCQSRKAIASAIPRTNREHRNQRPVHAGR